MKRKFILILAVLLFCSGIYVVARGLQTKSISNNQTEKQGEAASAQKPELDNNQSSQVQEGAQQNTGGNKAEPKSDSQTKSAVSNSGNSTAKPPVAPINFKIIDSVNNKIILSTNVDLENKTVGEITVKTLDSKGISYRAKGTGGSIYFSSISGLTETKAGPESGWCYYVNGIKSSIGAGGYKLKKGDMVEWKYLKDGISN